MKIAVIAAVFLLDQLTKSLAVQYLSGRLSPVVIIPRFLDLRYAMNLGAAFSLLQDRTLFLSLFTLVAIVSIFWLALNAPPHNKWLQYGYSLILGGAIGNLADRVFRGSGFLRGHVVDFIDAHWKDLHWPTFNIADSAITVGVGCVLLALLFVKASEPVDGQANFDESP